MAIDWLLTIEKTYIKNGEGSFERWYTEHGSGSTSFPVTITGNYILSGMSRDYRYTIDAVAYSGSVPRIAYYLTTSQDTPASTVFQLSHPPITGASASFISTSGCCVPVYVNNTYSFCQGNSPMTSISTNGTGRYPVTKHHISIDMPFCPIFATQTEAERYISGLDLDPSNALNYYEAETEPEGELFEIYNTGQRGTWSLGDIVTDVSTPFYRWFRVKLATTQGVDGRLAFYKQGLEDGVIKVVPVATADIVFCEYSTNGSTWEEWTGSGLPFDYIYGERTNELGTFIYATRSGLNGTDGAPVFDDEATALKWVNHDPSVDITDANNYGDLGNRYPIGNKTGQKETDTTMGTASNFKSHFTQKYILDSGDVVKIANAMLDTTSNIFEDIVEGLKMFGESIIDSVCSLVFFPIDLTTVFTRLSSQNYIFFGGYQYPPTGDPTSIQVYRVTGYDGYIDLGTVTIEPTYPEGDYRNTSDYCRVSIFLPYIGLTELSYEKYVGKQLKVRYYLDLNTGSTLVCLLCNDGDGFKLYDYLNGQMGAQIPITLTDASAYAQAELRNISNLASSITAGAVGLGTGLASRGSGIIQQAINGNTLGAVSEVGAMNAEGAVGAFSTGIGFSKALYDLKTTNINNFKTTKGGSGAIGNQYLPQYVYLIFEYIETEETPNLLQLEGRPSNKSGALESFSGYLEVDSVKLSCSYATENEKKEIEQLLNTGVYI